MDQIEMEGASVEEAVEAALRQLGRRPEEVEVKILSKGSKGFFGFGVRKAKVRVSLKEGGVMSPEAVGRAAKMLVRMIKLMGMDVDVEAKHFGTDLYLEVDQGAGGILIGRRGTTLAALSYIMERIVNQGEHARIKVFVDVAGYLERKRRSLVSMAEKVAESVKANGREYVFGPMSAFERKVIHTTLHNERSVRTFSRGEGMGRRVVIAAAGDGDGKRGGDRDRSWGERGRQDEGERQPQYSSDRGMREDGGGGPPQGGRGGRDGWRGRRGGRRGGGRSGGGGGYGDRGGRGGGGGQGQA